MAKTLEEKKAELELITQSLNQQVTNFIQEPETIVEFLQFMKRFPKYSFKNQLMLQSQNKEATFVGSFNFWKKEGYSVNRGEKSLKILAPSTVKMFVNKQGELKYLQDATPDEKQLIKQQELIVKDRIRGFKLVSVFDIRQTNMTLEDYPKYIRDIHSVQVNQNIEPHIQALLEYSHQQGINVVSRTLTPEKSGYIQMDNLGNRQIIINDLTDKQSATFFNTLLHELAHDQLQHLTNLELEIDQKEIQAESVSAIIMQYYGLGENPQSLNYIKSWGQLYTEEQRYQLMEQTLHVVGQLTTHIDQYLNHIAQLDFIRELYDLDKNHYSQTFLETLAQASPEHHESMIDIYQRELEQSEEQSLQKDIAHQDRYTLPNEYEYSY